MCSNINIIKKHLINLNTYYCITTKHDCIMEAVYIMLALIHYKKEINKSKIVCFRAILLILFRMHFRM